VDTITQGNISSLLFRASLFFGLAMVTASGCFEPQTREGVACSAMGACPQGQECHMGICFPKGQIPDGAPVDGPREACQSESLYSGESAAAALDLGSAAAVYWTSNAGATIISTPRVGGPSEVVHDAGAGRNIVGIALDATHLYWSENNADGRVMRKGLEAAVGEPGEVLADVQNLPAALALDATHVYWYEVGAGTVSRVPKAGGTVEVLATGQDMPNGIAVAGGDVFWTTSSGGTVMRVSKAGGTPMQLATGQDGASTIVAGADRVYWTNRVGDTVVSVPVAGGTPEVHATSQDGAAGISIDGTLLHWTNYESGEVWRLDLAGGVPRSVAVGQMGPIAVASDGANVYWLNALDSDQRVMHASCP
jgi:hypothetical protein